MERLSPRALGLAWLALSAAGALLIALPDDDARVFSLSEGHGPAPIDLAGIALVALGLAAYLAALVRGRARIGRRRALVALALHAPSSALAGWSVATDAGAWWMLGVAGALAAMGIALWGIVRR